MSLYESNFLHVYWQPINFVFLTNWLSLSTKFNLVGTFYVIFH